MKTQGTDSLFTVVIGGFFASMSYIIGGVDNLAIALAIFMATDYIMGITSSYYIKDKVTKEKMIKGLTKKSGLISFIIVAHQLDVITGNTSGFLRDAMIMFLVGTEGISIVENGKRMGYDIPYFIAEPLRKMAGIKKKEKKKKNRGA